MRYRDETLQAHCPRGGITTSKKFGGSDPPGGKFFPKFFFEISISKFEGVMPLTQEKICKKIFTIGDIGPALQRPTYGVQRVGVGYAARRRLCRRAIGHVTVTSK